MDPSAVAALLSPEGRALLEGLPPYAEADALRLGTALRARGTDPALVAAALTQARLRQRARAKFGDAAATMYLTPAGLEQATRREVAAHHARRYAAAGAGLVADLGCGLGGDAMALATAGVRVLAVEADAATAALAAANLARFPGVEVRHGDALAVSLDGVDAVFADPARRTGGGRRVFDPAAYSPPLGALLDLRTRVPDLGLKVAPGVPHAALPAAAHAQWVSVDGDVVEAGLWFAGLAPEGPGRSALVLGPRGAAVLAEPAPVPADAPVRAGQVHPLAAFLHEPDGAVIRAGLVARLAEDLGAGLVNEDIAYLTGDAPAASPFATSYRVLDLFDFGLKRLREYLRTRDVGALTIKKRGTAVEPEQLRRRLGLAGRASATVVLTRLAGRQVVIVVEPV